MGSTSNNHTNQLAMNFANARRRFESNSNSGVSGNSENTANRDRLRMGSTTNNQSNQRGMNFAEVRRRFERNSNNNHHVATGLSDSSNNTTYLGDGGDNVTEQDTHDDTVENPELDRFVMVNNNELHNNNDDNNDELALIRRNAHLQYQFQQLQNERDNEERERNHQLEQQNRNNRTVANGMCHTCGIPFPNADAPAGVRMMCDVEGHIMCDDCFGAFVRTQSSQEHIFHNEERFEIPGCYDQNCQNCHEGLQAFDPRIIAAHVNDDTFQAFMNGQRLFTERRIYEEERRREEEERRRVA
jgi:hypothetical protein